MFKTVSHSFDPLHTFGRLVRSRLRRAVRLLTFVLLGINLFYSFFLVGRRADLDTRHTQHALRTLLRESLPATDGWLDAENDTLYIRRLWEQEPPAGVSLFLFRDSALVYWSNDRFQADSDAFWLHPDRSLRQIDNDLLVSQLQSRNGKSAVIAVELYDRQRDRYNPALFPEQRIALSGSADSIRTPGGQAIPVAFGDSTFFVEALPTTAMPWWAESCGWVGILLLCFRLKNLVRRHTSRQNACRKAGLLFLLLALLRIGIHFSGIPNGNSILFRPIYGLYNPILVSLGDSILTYGFFFVFAVYLFQVRAKLSWRCRHSGPRGQVVAGLAFCTLIAGMVAIFHYALILSIYSPKINLQLNDIFDLSYTSLVFYLLAVLFVSARILTGYTNQSLFGTRKLGWRTAVTAAEILLFLLPVRSQLHHTEYMLVVFYLFSIGAHYLRLRYRHYDSFLISLLIFSLYISYFATQENKSARNNAQMLYARILERAPQERLLQYREGSEIDERNIDNRFRDFTYARVRNHRIDFRYGNGNDYQFLAEAIAAGRDTLIKKGGKRHLLYNYDSDGERTTLIISRKTTTLLDAVALFAYLFLLLFVLSGLLLEAAGYTFDIRRLGTRMTFRIRMVVIGVVLFAMISVTFVIIRHTRANFDEEQQRFVNNQMQRLGSSIVRYLESRPLDPQTAGQWIGEENKDPRYDINLFLPNGEVAGASDDHAHRLVRMNDKAYRQLRYRHQPFCTIAEGRDYLSAFAPVVVGGELRGYLNLEYYSSLDNSSVQHRKLLVDVLSLFLIILGVAVVLSELLYRLLAKPFNRLREALGNISRMQKIDAIGSGRKISDEVGLLIEQYNTMIDYLEESYRQLARSEREGAWREMARQVAHEIKNPLTPMRLKIQMLQHYLRHGSGDELRERVESTLDLLLEQIDLLTKIASEFSDFAKLGEGHPERVDLVPLVGRVAKLYSGDERIGIRLKIEGRPGDIDRPTGDPVWVNADPDHLTRVFVNISQNAVQAMAGQAEGRIDIELQREADRVSVRFRDSGPGIPEEIRAKIFVPNFTTKSSGSGLGLALSRKIVELLGGRIAFDTELGVGTTFTVELPLDPPPQEGAEPDRSKQPGAALGMLERKH